MHVFNVSPTKPGEIQPETEDKDLNEIASSLAIERAFLFHCPFRDLEIASITLSYLGINRLATRLLIVIDAAHNNGDLLIRSPIGTMLRMRSERISMPMDDLLWEHPPQTAIRATGSATITSSHADFAACARLCDELAVETLSCYDREVLANRPQRGSHVNPNSAFVEELDADLNPDSTEMIVAWPKTPESSLDLCGITAQTKIGF